MASFFVPTRFTWQFGGQVVHLCGSFTRWVETVPMTPVDSRPTVFQVVVHLPPGYHQYKFIVDGEWRHDETQPFMPDPLGNVNNWLFVRRPEAQPQNPGKIKEFLLTHTAYELIPESGKVVLLDLELPVRQAFHALHEQNVPSAPLWDAASATVAGMISASDFIHILVQLRNSVSSGASAMSEAEMDQHTLRGLRQVAEADGRPFKQLVAVQPQEDLHAFVERLCVSEVSMAPVLTTENTGQGEVCTMLHIATVSGVLGCLMRHFRASLSSLPLLSVAVGSLPVGTWAEDSRYAHEQGEERRDRRRVRRLHTVTLRTPLTTALRLLLESGCSSLPVLDETGALVNVYARSDITTLCKGNSYNRAVLERLCSSSVRRLYVVEPKTRHVEGIISLSDLAAYLC
eukprot:jgi/Astpho2/2429/fgenesh1_pm.00044_%23_15_t